MVAIADIKKQVSSLVHSRPLVAVFIGGTSGIGENTVRELASVHGASGPGLRAYIVGRNEQAANETIAFCRHKCPNGQFVFVRCQDLTLIKDVDKTCNEIIRLETEATHGEKGKSARIDMLYISSGKIMFGTEDENEEGLTPLSSLVYYSRMRAIVNLLPLLKASSMPAHVVSVFGAGLESGGKFHPDDLALQKKENKGAFNMRNHAVRMTTLFLEVLVEKEPNAPSFVHVFPGFVMTPAFLGKQLPVWFRFIFRALSPIFRLMAFTPEENGERMLHLSTSRYPAKSETTRKSEQPTLGSDGVRARGAYAIGKDNETISQEWLSKYYEPLRSDGIGKRVYDHTMKVFEVTSSGGRFTE